MISSEKNSRVMRGHVAWHLAGASVGVAVAVMFAWIVSGDAAAHERAMQGLSRELAAHERGLARARLGRQELSADGRSNATQVEALDRVYERLALLSRSGGDAQSRQHEERRLKRRIDCYPYEVRTKVEQQRGIKKQCGCAPDDPLCSCL